jgi:hypothetical protein
MSKGKQVKESKGVKAQEVTEIGIKKLPTGEVRLRFGRVGVDTLVSYIYLSKKVAKEFSGNLARVVKP